MRQLQVSECRKICTQIAGWKCLKPAIRKKYRNPFNDFLMSIAYFMPAVQFFHKLMPIFLHDNCSFSAICICKCSANGSSSFFACFSKCEHALNDIVFKPMNANLLQVDGNFSAIYICKCHAFGTFLACMSKRGHALNDVVISLAFLSSFGGRVGCTRLFLFTLTGH